MRRVAPALAASLALAAGCTQDPPGRCEGDLDCRQGQICLEGVCARLETDGQIGSLCARDTDCVAWGQCLSRTCELRAGACEADLDCENWEVCDLDLHACATAPGGCADGSWCGYWEDCVAWRCETAAGQCGDDRPCAAGEVCDGVHLCATLDSAAVYLLGTFLDASGTVEAACALSSPARPVVGFPAGVGPTARIGPGSLLVYERASATRSLYRFEADALEWNAAGAVWGLPADPVANDVLLSTPGCPDVGEWVMQAGTGEVRYACAADVTVWYGTSSATPVVSGYRVLAWGSDGRMLATRAADDVLVVLDDLLAETVVSGAPPLTGYGVLAVRTRAGGFWLAVVPPGPAANRRWAVTGAGGFADDGAYSAAPAELSAGTPAALDASGALILSGVRLPAPPQDVVLRCELDPAGCTSAYDEADAASQDWSTSPPTLYLLSDRSPLATGP